MEEKIKDIEVIAYKGMKFNMTCWDFKYELGKTYKTDKAKLCEWGFHACLNPRDVLDYYYQEESSRYFKVLLSGEIAKCGMWDTNVAATEITILEEITDNFNEVIETTEWCKNDNVLDLLYFSDGFARVQRGDGLWNFIDKDGNYLSDEWFDWVDYFQDGFARVQRTNDKWNFIDKNGNYLSDEWFELVGDFREGFARVQRTNDRLYNFMDKQGNYLFTKWFYWLDNFKDGLARVKRGDDKWNFIDKQGNYLSDEWFDWAGSFQDGLAQVRRGDNLYNFIDANGKIISNEWFYSVEDFR